MTDKESQDSDPEIRRAPHNGSAATRPVLLLNASYEPLTTLSTRRAVVLVLREKADVVHADDGGRVLHSATLVVEVPSVIRLRRYIKVPYGRRLPLTRVALMRRDDHRCAYCGRRAETIDHVVPRSKGGPHTWENCVASCSRCNHHKADRTLAELGWTLHVTPKVPRGVHWRLIGCDNDPLWAPYLARHPAA